MATSEEPTSSMWAVQSLDGASISSEAQANFHRITALIVNTGGAVLRSVMKRKLPPGQDLKAFLIFNAAKIAKLEKNITEKQMTLLQDQQPELDKFDITLLVFLLRNLFNISPKHGWKEDPDPDDETLGADLMRIKDWRNQLAHSVNTGLSNEDFEQLWGQIQTVLLRLSSPGVEREKIQQDINEGKVRLLDTFTDREKQLWEILLKWYQSSIIDPLQETRQQIQNLTSDVGKLQEDVASLRIRNEDLADAALERRGIKETLNTMQQAFNQVGEEFGLTANAALRQTALDEVQRRAKLDQNRSKRMAQDLENRVRDLQEDLDQGMTRALEPRLRIIEDQLGTLLMLVQGGTTPFKAVSEKQPGGFTGMSDREILAVARKLSKTWKMLAIHMGYTYDQTETLEAIYNNKVTERATAMLNKWHAVVVKFKQDPRLLLAKACCDMENCLLASEILGEKRFRNEKLNDVKISSDLEEAIQGITFEEQPRGSSSSTVNYGGSNSQNFFGGRFKLDSMTIHPSPSSYPSPTLPTMYGEPVKMPDGTINYGGHNSQNFYGAEVEARHLSIGEPHSYGNPGLSPEYRNYGRDRRHGDVRGEIRHEQPVPPARTSSTTTGNWDETDNLTGAPGYGGETDNLTGAPGYGGESGYFKKDQDDVQAEDIHDAINCCLKSVGLLVTRKSSGTAFRVGSKYVMTAWHVIRDCADPFKTGQMDFSNLEKDGVYVNFSTDPLHLMGNIFSVSSQNVYFDEELDVAVVELKIRDGSSFPPNLPLCMMDSEWTDIRKLCVLGFGHPDSNKKSEEKVCIIRRGEQREREARSWVNQNTARLKELVRSQGRNPDHYHSWAYDDWDESTHLAVDMYKEKGSSGSPALSFNDSRHVKVMAVVVRGMPDCFWDLPKSIQLAFPNYARIELVVKMNKVFETMSTKNSPLANDLFTYQ